MISKLIQRIKSKLSSDNNLKELFTGSSITFVLKVSGMVFSYLVVLIISNNYNAEGVGIYNLSQRIIRSLGIVCALGFNVSVLRYVGQFNVNDNRGIYLRKIFKYFIQLSLPFSLVIAIALYSFSDGIALHLFENKEYKKAIKIIAIVLPLFTINLISVEFIRGLKLLKVSEYLRSINVYLIVFIILALGILNFQLLNSVYALSIGVAITFLASIFYILSHLNKLKLFKQEVEFSRKEFIATSLPMMIITISSFILAFSGVFFLELFSTTDKVGIYSTCVMLAQLVSIALTVVNTISAPKFSELYWNNKKKELTKLLRHSSKLIFWSSLFVSIMLILFSKYILALFGEEFLLGQITLFVLILGQIINATTGSVGVFMNMTGHQKVLRNIILITALLVVLCYYFVIPSFGMLGAALVSISGTTILNIFSVIYVYKKLNYVTYYIPFLKTKHD